MHAAWVESYKTEKAGVTAAVAGGGLHPVLFFFFVVRRTAVALFATLISY